MNLPYFSFIYFAIATLRNITRDGADNTATPNQIAISGRAMLFVSTELCSFVDFWSCGVAAV